MLDDVDYKILDALQKNGRVRRSDLAELVGMSLPATSDRLRKLEERGFILGYAAVLDHQKFSKDVTAFVHVFVDTSRHYDNFLKHVSDNPDILECHAVTGEGSHLLKIRTETTATLEAVLSQIQAWKEVQRTRTSIVLSTRKETLNISLPDSSTQS
ncbi:MAG: AsnC family transcriptional regulator [Ignavibacteria bacterium]|nr:MAG: AsnC family transcriptional regulator [Ignavibacteria bacterium]